MVVHLNDCSSPWNEFRDYLDVRVATLLGHLGELRLQSGCIF